MKKISLVIVILLLSLSVISCDKDKDNEESMNVSTYEYQSNKENPMGFDLYMPETPKGDKAPLLIYVHGGSWVRGNKEAVLSGERETFIIELLEDGYAVASIDYTLLNDENSFPTNLEDVIEAINYIVDNHESLNIDVNNIGVWGTSAGAHLVLLAAQNEEIASKIDYVIDYFGPTDLISLLVNSPQANEKGFELFFGKENALDESKINEVAYNLSPINHPWLMTLPLLMVQGDSDDTVPMSQTQDLYDSFMALGVVDLQLMIIEDGPHSLLNNRRVDDSVSREIIDATKTFIYSQYE